MKEDELRRYEALEFAQRLESLAKEHLQRLERIRASWASRGLLSSTGWLNDARLEFIDYHVRIARAHVESADAAHKALGIGMNERTLDRLVQAVMRQHHSGVRSVQEQCAREARALQLESIWNHGKQGDASVERDLGAEQSALLRELDKRRIVLKAVTAGASTTPQWDVFIAHASEDKETIAKPLAAALIARGVNVWADWGEIRLGDSLGSQIDNGLSNSRFGCVLLSKNFFEKQWARMELDAMFSREAQGRKVILPIVQGLSHDQLLAHSSLSAGKLYVRWENGIERVTQEILAVVRGAPTAP